MVKRFRYRFAASGGTFDRFHKGHAAFLRKAFASARRVLVGVVRSQRILRGKKLYRIIEPYETRLESLKKFLKENGFARRSVIVPLKDEFGPAPFGERFDSIIATRETLANARKINALRRKRRLKPLELVFVRMAEAEDAKPISSTRVREGRIDRKGIVFGKRLLPTSFELTVALRRELKKPLALLFSGSEEAAARRAARALKKVLGKKIFVGDAAVRSLAEAGVKPDVAVVDYKIKRKKISADYSKILSRFDGNRFRRITASNPPGRITRSLSGAVEKALRKGDALLEVKGEEDLAVVPAVLLAPLRSVIAYGQPNEGLVLVEVTEPVKQKVLSILERFKRVRKSF